MLILLVFGIIDFGGVMNAQAVINNAVREGARSAALGSSSTLAAQGVRSAMSQLPGASDTAVTTVSVTCTSPTSVVDATCTSTTDSGGTVVVVVNYRYSWLSPVPLGLGNTITISQQSQMRIE